jgi:hypothetical protein
MKMSAHNLPQIKEIEKSSKLESEDSLKKL